MHHPDAFLNGRPAPLPDTAAWPSRCRASGTGGCRRHPPYRPRSWTGSLRRPGGSCLQICRLHRVCPASKAGNCYLPTITIGTGGDRRQTGCLSWSGVMGRRRKPRSMCSLDRNDGAIAAGSLRGVSRLRKGQTECASWHAERQVAGESVPAPLARLGPMTTTTSIPVVPVTGAAVVNGCTAEELTPSSEAIKAASGCLVGA